MSRFIFSRGAVAAAVFVSMAVVATVPASAASASALGGPPPVLNPLTADVPTVDFAAVQALESLAINQVLNSHGLPSSDGSAVLSWARDDVRATEFADLTQIINEGATARGVGGTGVLPNGQDQLVYNWFQGVIQQRNISAAQQAINEFFRWSGLTSLSTASPLNYGPTQSFPGGYGNGAPVPTGFCGFSPPGGSAGPFAGTYNASSEEDCYIPCTDQITDCFPPEPNVSQFEQWGLYDAESITLGSPDYMSAGAGTAIAEGAGVAAAIAGFTLPVSVGIKAGPLLTRFASEVAPYAVRVITQAGAAIAAASAKAATEAGTVAAETASEVVAAATGALSVSLITGIVGVVIDFIISTVLAGITLNQELTEPTQLQQVLTDAQTTSPDLASVLSSSGGTGELYSAFIAQTLPEAQTDCTVNPTDPCFTPTTPPAHTGSDPSFLVTPVGGVGTVQSSIYTVDPLGLYYNNTYMSGGGWFVSQRFNAFDSANATTATDGGATVQSLSLPYTDWSGNHWSAERVVSGTQTKFALTPLDAANSGACALLPDGTSPCLTDTLQMRVPGSGGVPFDETVKIVPATSLIPTVHVGYATPGIAGSPITFTPNGYDPSNLNLTYIWSFPVSGDQGCPIDVNTGVLSCFYTQQSVDPSGQTSYTFLAPGDFEASVVAKDANGYSTSESFNVAVAGSTSVSVASSAVSSVSTQPVTFTATVNPSGGGDCTNFYFGPHVTGYVQFQVDGVNYGNLVELQGTNCSFYSGGEVASITDSTLTPGHHLVTARYLGNPEYTASSLTVDQTVNPETDTTTITPSFNSIVHGQGVSFRAQVAPVAPGTGLPTGSVQFYADGVALGSAVPLGSDGTATSPVTTSLQVNQFLSTPSPNVQAIYSGDAAFPTSTGTYREIVNSDPTTTTITSSRNPSELGQPVSLKATVASTAPGGGTPSGCVQFAVDGVNVGSRLVLDASGAATLPALNSLGYTGTGTAYATGHVVSATYLTLDSTCQRTIPNSPYLSSSGTLAPAQTVNVAGTPADVRVSAPTTLSGAFTVHFSGPVKGIDPSATTNVTLNESGSLTPTAAIIVCKNAQGTTVDCAVGPVSTVSLSPKDPLLAGANYVLEVGAAGTPIATVAGALTVALSKSTLHASTVVRVAQDSLNETWRTVKSPLAHGGSFLQETSAGASVSTALNLTTKSAPGVVLIKGPAQGIASVSIFRGTARVSTHRVDTYASTFGTLTLKLGPLPAGKYSLRVAVKGAKNARSTGYAVGLDAVVANGVTTATPVTTATWALRPDGHGTKYAFSGQAGATTSLQFHGPGIALTVLTGPHGGEAQVLIDGKIIATQDQYAARTARRTFFYGGLSDTLHKVTMRVLAVRNKASRGSVVTLDGAKVK